MKNNKNKLHLRLGVVILALASAASVNTTGWAEEGALVVAPENKAKMDEVADIDTHSTRVGLITDIDQVIAEMQKEGIQTNAASIYSAFQKASKEGKYLIRQDEDGYQKRAKYRKLFKEAENPILQPDMESITKLVKVVNIDKVVEQMQQRKEELNGRNLFVAVGKLNKNPDDAFMVPYCEQKASYEKYATLLAEGYKALKNDRQYNELSPIAREAIATKTDIKFLSVNVDWVIQDMQTRGVEMSAFNLFVEVYKAFIHNEEKFLVPYKAGMFLPYIKDIFEGQRVFQNKLCFGETIPEELRNYKGPIYNIGSPDYVGFISPELSADQLLVSLYQKELIKKNNLHYDFDKTAPGMFAENPEGYPKIDGLSDQVFVRRSDKSWGDSVNNYCGMFLSYQKEGIVTNRANIQFALLPINKLPQQAIEELNSIDLDLTILRKMDQPPTGATLKIPELLLAITVTAAPDSLYNQFQLPRGIGVRVTECVPEKTVTIENRNNTAPYEIRSSEERLLKNSFQPGDIILKARGQWVTTPPHLRDILRYETTPSDNEETEKKLKTPAFVCAWDSPCVPVPEKNKYAQFIVVRDGAVITLQAPILSGINYAARLYAKPYYMLGWREEDPDFKGKDDMDFWWGRLPMNVPDIGIRANFEPETPLYSALKTGYIPSVENKKIQASLFYNIWQRDDQRGLVIGKLDADSLSAKAGLSSYSALLDVTLPSDVIQKKDQDGKPLPITLFEEHFVAQRINSLAHFYTLLEMELMRSGSLDQVTLYGYDGMNEEMLWMNLNPDKPERFGVRTARSYIEKQNEIIEAEANHVRSVIAPTKTTTGLQKLPPNSSVVSVQKRIDTLAQPIQLDNTSFKAGIADAGATRQVLPPSITGLFDDRREELAKRWKECCVSIDNEKLEPDARKKAEAERKKIEEELDRMDFYFGPNALNRELKSPQNDTFVAKQAELAQKWKELSAEIDSKGDLSAGDRDALFIKMQRAKVENEIKLLQNIISPGSVTIDPFERYRADLVAEWITLGFRLSIISEEKDSVPYKYNLKKREEIANELETIQKRFSAPLSDSTKPVTEPVPIEPKE